MIRIVTVLLAPALLMAGGQTAAAQSTKVGEKVPLAAPAAARAPELPFESSIRYFEDSDREIKTTRSRIVFTGSSSIRMWETLGNDFPGQYVINRGFGGSQISDVVHYADRIIVPHKPPLVVVYAGSNDIDAGKTPQTVAADFKTLTTRIWSRLPATSIAFISIAPNPARWAQADRVREANRLIAAYCHSDRRLEFIDVFPRMLGTDGKPRPELFIHDGLHMNRKGYEIWVPLVRETMDAVVPPKAPRLRVAPRRRSGASPRRRPPRGLGRDRARRARHRRGAFAYSGTPAPAAVAP
jgi:lysophospholipase L1-like esterase